MTGPDPETATVVQHAWELAHDLSYSPHTADRDWNWAVPYRIMQGLKRHAAGHGRPLTPKPTDMGWLLFGIPITVDETVHQLELRIRS